LIAVFGLTESVGYGGNTKHDFSAVDDLHCEGLETGILQLVQETDKSVYKGSVAYGMNLRVERL